MGKTPSCFERKPHRIRAMVSAYCRNGMRWTILGDNILWHHNQGVLCTYVHVEAYFALFVLFLNAGAYERSGHRLKPRALAWLRCHRKLGCHTKKKVKYANKDTVVQRARCLAVVCNAKQQMILATHGSWLVAVDNDDNGCLQIYVISVFHSWECDGPLFSWTAFHQGPSNISSTLTYCSIFSKCKSKEPSVQ